VPDSWHEWVLASRFPITGQGTPAGTGLRAEYRPAASRVVIGRKVY